MSDWEDMRLRLDELAASDLLRGETVVDSACGPKVMVGGRELVCFCSNDYLGLAADPAVRAAAVEAVATWGVGAGASRLAGGTTSAHKALERRLAEFKGAADALVTSTGWMANRVAVHALATRGDLVLCDKLCHASVIDAARSCGARMRTFPHCDVKRLAALLDRRRAAHRRCLIVTDSLFSMDGDFAPLRELVEIKDRFDARLLIDEAHATGVIGPDGRGVAEMMGVEDRVDVTVGTLSKAIGCLGGFVAGEKVLMDTIRNTGRAYIYTTAPPPLLCAAATAALDIIQREPERRQRLLAMAEGLRARLAGDGLRIGNSASQIIPVILGTADRALQAGQALLEQGFLVPAIRPPTVARGASRLRISISAAHDPPDLLRMAEALQGILARG